MHKAVLFDMVKRHKGNVSFFFESPVRLKRLILRNGKPNCSLRSRHQKFRATPFFYGHPATAGLLYGIRPAFSFRGSYSSDGCAMLSENEVPCVLFGMMCGRCASHFPCSMAA
ncbi:unnamed protein product [Rangifer tarandus platyrhynchus]|uniref:Uncharacterized protein n=1 Tax=Rangifer tarandus platyrhynchus TaxID=3082113 RepID=A0ABN8XMA1_RANTA|nr:unnamed protein product [Rangifer tarandus platyrhynchus]